MNSMDQGTGKFMRKFSKDKAKIESISLRKNRWVPIAFILVVSCWIRCGSTQLDINIFLLNTEFFFDNLPPHGRIVGHNIPIPTKQEYESEEKSIAVLIDQYEANLVGLAEVENRAVVVKVKSHLKKP